MQAYHPYVIVASVFELSMDVLRIFSTLFNECIPQATRILYLVCILEHSHQVAFPPDVSSEQGEDQAYGQGKFRCMIFVWHMMGLCLAMPSPECPSTGPLAELQVSESIRWKKL